MGIPHLLRDALADSYHSGFSWNMAHKFSGLRGAEPAVHPEKQRVSRHSTAECLILQSKQQNSATFSFLFLCIWLWMNILFTGILTMRNQSRDHLTSTLPQVNPAPNADSSTQSPLLSIFFPYVSDMARGMVAAVVFP